MAYSTWGGRELDTTEQLTLYRTCTSAGAGRGNVCQKGSVFIC